MQVIPNETKQRFRSIDILRGLIMVIMALDHVRDYFSNVQFDPLDIDKTTPVLFLTRWITHLCAPTFIFLAGTSVFLSQGNRKTKKETSLFLVKRGLWLILLELTLLNFGWFFNTGFHVLVGQVIWAIGWSMIVLAALIYLKPLYVGLIGLLMITGHNAFDQVHADTFGNLRPLWLFLHEQGMVSLGKSHMLMLFYPLIPWAGVMAAGYSFGTLFNLDVALRKRWFIRIGSGCLIAFGLIRFLNKYGDPFPWHRQEEWWKTVLSFINCNKYPPSLLYLLITLGISILLLGLLEAVNNPVSRIFQVYGSVPFFYYILHIYLVHILQIAVAAVQGVPWGYLFNGRGFTPINGSSFGLGTVYLFWILVVGLLYLPCRWFMKVKKRRNDWWLSYL